MNGTFINDERVAKGKARTLSSGDTVRLSFATSDNPPLEFRFEELIEGYSNVGDPASTSNVVQEGRKGQGDISPSASVSRGSKRRASTEPPEVGQQPNGPKRQANKPAVSVAAAAVQTPRPKTGGDQPVKSPPTSGTAQGAGAGPTPAKSPPAPSPAGAQAPARSPPAGAVMQPAAQPAPAAEAAQPKAKGPDSSRVSAGGEDPLKQAQAMYYANQELRAQIKEQRRVQQKLLADSESTLRQTQALHKEETAKLHERLSAVEAQLRQQAVQLATNSTAEAELAENKARLAASHEELQAVRSELWGLKNELCKSRAAEHMLAEQVAELTKVVAQEQTARATAQEDLQGVRAALSAETLALAAARRTLEELQQEQQATKQELAAHATEGEALRRQLAEAARKALVYEKDKDEAEELTDRLNLQTMMAHAASAKATIIDQKVQETIRFLTGLQSITGPFASFDMPQLCSGQPPTASGMLADFAAADPSSQAAGPAAAVQHADMDMRFGSPARPAASATLLHAATQGQQATQQVHALAALGHSPAAARDWLAAPTQAAGTQVAGYHFPAPRVPMGQPHSPPATPTRATLSASLLPTGEQRLEAAPGEPQSHAALFQTEAPGGTTGGHATVAGSDLPLPEGTAPADNSAAQEAGVFQGAPVNGSLSAWTMLHASGVAVAGALAGSEAQEVQDVHGTAMDVDQENMQHAPAEQPASNIGSPQQQLQQQELPPPVVAEQPAGATETGLPHQQNAPPLQLGDAGQLVMGFEGQTASQTAANLALLAQQAVSQAPAGSQQPAQQAGSQPVTGPQHTAQQAGSQASAGIQQAGPQPAVVGEAGGGSMAVKDVQPHAAPAAAGPHAPHGQDMAAVDPALHAELATKEPIVHHDVTGSGQLVSSAPGTTSRTGRLSIAAALGCQVTPSRALQTSVRAAVTMTTPQSHAVAMLSCTAGRVASLPMAPEADAQLPAQAEGQAADAPAAAQQSDMPGAVAGSSSPGLPDSDEDEQQAGQPGGQPASSGAEGADWAWAGSAQAPGAGGGLLNLGREPESLAQLNDITNIHGSLPGARGSSACDGSQLVGAHQAEASGVASGKAMARHDGGSGEEQLAGRASQVVQLPSGGDSAGSQGLATSAGRREGSQALLSNRQVGAFLPGVRLLPGDA